MHRVIIIALVSLLIPSSSAFDFAQYKTCKDCIKAGFGWCSIRRMCGGFANQECGEGERFYRDDYIPPGSEKAKAPRGERLPEEKDEEKKPKPTPLRNFQGVIPLVSDNFTAVTKSDELWLVEFFAPWCGHCKALAPEWEKAAKALKGVVRLGAVDADSGPGRSVGSQYGVGGFPTIKVFGANKKDPLDYDGGRKAPEIVAYALKAATKLVEDRLGSKIKTEEEPKNEEKKKKEEKKQEEKKQEEAPSDDDVVKSLTLENFDETVLASKEMWLVEFFAPWCGHCKALAPEWAKAASILKGTANVAAVDATVHGELAKKYGVDGYPTIKVFEAGKTGEEKKPLPAEFGRSTEAIVNYVYDKLEESGVPRVVPELTNDASFQKCLGTKYCIIALLPHLIDTGASGRTELIAVISAVSKEFRSFPAGFYWMQGGVQTKFEESLTLGGSGYPEVVILDKARSRYVRSTTKFEQSALVKLIRQLQQGRAGAQNFPVSTLKLSDVQPWDGEDYKSSEEL